jgi:hypothetical protein
MVQEQLSGTETRHSNVTVTLGLLYLIALPLNIELRQPVFAHDLLAAAFLVFILVNRSYRDMLNEKGRLLSAFLLLIVLTTALNAKGAPDIYELGIFFYMAVLFLFFSQGAIPLKYLFCYGAAALVAMAIYATVQYAAGAHDVYNVYADTILDAISRRFFFTFSHPNLTGSFYALPVACVFAGWRSVSPEENPRKDVLFLVSVALLCIPLALTVSRHMLITVALGLGFLGSMTALRGSRTWRIGSWTALVLIFLLFCLTFIYPFFPLKKTFPYFNANTYGMYIIHHVIYFKMIFMNSWSFLLGLGRSGVIKFYPVLADWDSAYSILAQYRQEFLTERFTTYMDAHNEYLNIGTAFGVPAAICVYAFWFLKGRRADRSRTAGMLLAFFAASIFMVSFWDDILSKRWIWITLGILATCSADRDNKEEESPDETNRTVPLS